MIRILVALSGAIAVIAAGEGRAEPGTDRSDPAEIQVRGISESNDGWIVNLIIELASDQLTKATTRVSLPGRLHTADEFTDLGALRQRALLIPRNGLEEGDVAIVDVVLEFGMFWAAVYESRFFFRLTDGRLLEEDGTTYLNSLRDDRSDPNSAFVFVGGWLPPAAGTENLEGWENPSIPEEKRQELWRLHIESHPDAARVPKRGSAAPSPADESVGCGGAFADESLATGLILLALAISGKRRKGKALMFALFLTTLTSAATSSHAKSVNGFIAFYENRTYTGSTATGSRLTTPSGGTGCLPSTPNCIYRPVPFVKVEIQDELGNVWSDESDADGFFDIQGITGNDPDGYDLFVAFENTANPRALIRLTGSTPPAFNTFRFVWKDFISAPNSGPNYVGRIDVSSSAGTSVAGDVAAA